MIKALVSKFILPYESYLWIVAALAIFGWGVWAVHHERAIGRQQVVAADAKARADEHVKIVAEEARLQAAADAAERERDAIAKQFTDYATAHPVGVVRLCRPTNHQPAGTGQATGTDAANAATGSGPATVPPVLDGGAGADLGPSIDAILSAAERLGTDVRQFQHQPLPKPVK